MKALPFEAQVPWQKEELSVGGDEYFRRICSEIDKAVQSIDLEVYIFEYRKLGQEICARLIAAAKRGVKVRVLVDRVGTLGWIDELEETFEGSEVQFRVYHPFLVLVLSWFSYVNHRDHRKTWIFDDRAAGISSCNISDEHLRAVKGDQAWIDYGLVIEDPRISAFRRDFERAWAGSFQRRKRSDLLSLLSLGKKRIWIGTPYFVPTIRQLRLLVRMRRHGVEVKILISRKSDVFFMPWLMTSYYAILLRAGIEVFQYDHSVFHGKVVIVDEWYRIGTSNFNHRSLLHDMETDVMVTHNEGQARLAATLEESFKRSEKLTRHQLESESIFKKAITQLIYLFKWWF